MPAASALRKKASLSAGNSRAAYRRSLLHWYDQNRRQLPWRESRDPYRVWLSEIMLQQTRVSAVLDHYRRFLQIFPDVETLAAAPEDAVLAAWSGLGYYRRARMLHRCARELVEKYGGSFPVSATGLEALPGIGRYTAAAIASIAFEQPVAVVDGNVERVLQRLTAIDLSAAQTWQHADVLLDRSRPGDFNQAMMELGATVCTPRAPLCLVCPVRKWCDTQGEAPRTTRLPRQNKKEIWCALAHRDSKRSDGEVRLVQRSRKDSLMPGMWELPQFPDRPEFALQAPHWRTFRHSITTTDYTVHVLRASRIENGLPANSVAKARWIAVSRLPQIPITGLTRKILRAGGII